MDYNDFINSKRQSLSDGGFYPNWIPDSAFDFQREIIVRATKRGRCGLFLDTGLGKTMIQLSIAKNVVETFNKRVLILTPLAVAFQFLQEADRIGIDDIEQSKDGKFTKKIIVANYERLHFFNANDFECVMLDESSILKNFNGSTKNEIISFMKKVKYRFLSTATPSPNDFIELGNSSEALGHMGYMDMLSKFFKSNQNSIDSNNRNIGEKFYLKPHAENDFFSWINQWAYMIKKPSDIGFSDDNYKLPELILNNITVKNDDILCINGQVSLFSLPAKTMSEVRSEQKQTTSKRCETAVELANGKTSVFWCNTNDESKLISQLDNDAVEIIGSMSIEKKEEIWIAFAKGDIERIITKASMTSMGLNWQHCNHSVFFPTWSYEQYYQAIRRFWRFGQKRSVTIDIVASEGQERVIDAIQQKTKKAKELYESIVKNVNSNYISSIKQFNQQTTLPEFLK